MPNTCALCDHQKFPQSKVAHVGTASWLRVFELGRTPNLSKAIRSTTTSQVETK
jgi:hypothetical protein